MKTFALILLCGCGVGFGGRTERFELASSHVGATFVVSVWLPAAYAASTNSFPTVFQLDGETQAEVVARYAEEQGLELIVVGIAAGSSANRFRDYTPSEDSRYGLDTGRGADFAAFVARELLPRVEADYRASSQGRTLMGHSLGGLAVITQFLSQRGQAPTFANFGAASPSLWWDSGEVLQLEKTGRTAEPGTRVFLSTAAVESADIVLYGRELAERLEAPAYQGLRLLSTTYADTGHSWSYEKAYRDALAFFYAD